MADLPKMKPLPPLTGVAGLGNIFKDAAKAIEEVKNSGTSLGLEAAALASDINTVRQHVRREHEDFHFKVATLGNGGESQSDKQETKSEDSQKKEETKLDTSSDSFQPGQQSSATPG